MTLNFKALALVLGTLALAAGLTAPPADACRKAGWKSADAGAVYGWKHHERWKHHRRWKHAMK